MNKKIIISCPYCGCTETVKGAQMGHGAVMSVQNVWGSGVQLYHDICRDCGSVVRSYVKDPEQLLKRKYRRPRVK